MQKKLIVSLLATPMAFGAMADITVVGSIPTDGWKVGATPGVGYTQEEQENGGVLIKGQVGTDKITQTIKREKGNIPAGTYKFVFDKATNVAMSITAGDKTFTPAVIVAEDGSATSEPFFIPAEVASIEVTISSADTKVAFSFLDAELVIDINVKAINKSYEDALAALKDSLVPVEPDDDSDVAKALREQLKKVEAEIDKINTTYKLPLFGNDEDKADIETYVKYNLAGWTANILPTKDDPKDTKYATDDISKAIQALETGAVKKYNDDATAENNTFNNNAAKKAALEALTNEGGLQYRLDQVKKDIEAKADALDTEDSVQDAILGYVYPAAGNDVTKAQKVAQDVIDAYTNALEAAYADPTKDPKEVEAEVAKIKDPNAEFEKAYDKYSEVATDFYNDAKVYYFTVPENLKNLEAQYALAYTNLIQVQGVNLTVAPYNLVGAQYNYTTWLNSWVAARQAEITADRDAAKVSGEAITALETPAGAYKLYNDTPATDKTEAVDGFDTLYEAALAKFAMINGTGEGEEHVDGAWQTLVDGQADIMVNNVAGTEDAEAKKYVGGFAEIVANMTVIEQAVGNNDKYKETLAGIKAGIADVNKYIKDNYPGLTLDNETLAGLIAKIHGDLGYDQLAKDVQAIIDATNNLALAEKYIKDECTKAELTELISKFDETIQTIKDAISKLGPKDSTADIEEGIQNIYPTVDALIENFQDAQKFITEDLGGILDASVTGFPVNTGLMGGLTVYINGDKNVYPGDPASTFASTFMSDKDGVYASLKNQIIAFVKAYNDALAAPTQECYDQVVALGEKIKAYNGATLASVTYAYEFGATKANIDAAQADLNAQKTAIGKISLNKGELDLLELLGSAITTIQNEINAANNKLAGLTAADLNVAKLLNSKEKYSSGFDEIDNALLVNIDEVKDAAGNITTAYKPCVKQQITDLSHEVDAAVQLVAQINLAQGAIDIATKTNDETSVSGAHTYYLGEIQKLQDTLDGYISDIASILEDPNKTLDSEKGSPTVKGSLIYNIRKVKSAAEDLEGEIRDNQAAYDELLALAQTISSDINSLKEQIENSTNNPEVDAEKIPDWLDTLNGYLDDLANINRETGNFYTKGQFGDGIDGENYTTQKEQYDALKGLIDDLYNTVYGADGIQKINKDLFNAWQADQYTKLRQQYVLGIDEFNQYSLSNINNVDFYNHIVDAIAVTHEAFYKYSKAITDLYEAFNAEVTEANAPKDTEKHPNPYLITQEWFKKNIADKAAEYQTEMAALITQLHEKSVEAAEKYIPDHLEEMSDQVKEAKRILTDQAGMNVQEVAAYLEAALETISTIDGNFEDAQDAYTEAINAEEPDIANAVLDFVKACSAIATEIDGTAQSIKDGTIKAWNAYYGVKVLSKEKPVSELNKLITDVNGFIKKAAPNTDLDNFNAAKDALQNLSSVYAKLTGMPVNCVAHTNEATEDHNALINLINYLGYLSDQFQNINDQMDAANAAYDNLKAYNDQQVAISGFGTAVVTLKGLLNNLKDFDADLAGDGSYDPIISAIAAVESVLNQYKDNYADNISAIQAKIDAANDAIARGYQSVVVSEYTAFVGTNLDSKKPTEGSIFYRINMAYNDCRDVLDKDGKPVLNGYFEDEADAQAWNQKIEDLKAAVDKLYTKTNVEGNFTKDGVVDPTNAEFISQAQELESQAGELLDDLQKLYKDNNPDFVTDLFKIRASLAEQYTALADKIAAARDAEAIASVIADFEDEYNDLLEDLGDVNQAWQDAGAQVLMTYKEYERKYAAIDAKLTKINEKAEFAAKNLAALNGLNTKIDDLKSTYNELVNLAGEDQLDVYDIEKVHLDVINVKINALATSVDTQYKSEAGLLGAGTVAGFESEIKALAAVLDTEHLEIAQTYMDKVLNEYDTKFNAAYSSTYGHVVDASDFRQQLLDQRADFLKIYNTNVENLGEFQKAIIALEESDEWSLVGEADLNVDYGKQIQAIVDEIKTIAEDINKNKFTPGDINGQPGVNVADLQLLVEWVGKGVTYDDIKNDPNYGPAIAAAADLIGDGEINIVDVTRLIQIIFAENDPFGSTQARAPRNAEMQTVAISMAPMGEVEDGVRRYAVLLNNPMSLCAAQMDIVLPSNCELVNVSLSDRAEGHDIARFDNAAGARVIITSLENANFNGDGGQLVFIDVRGAGAPEVGEAIFSDSKSNGFIADNKGLTLIDSIYETAREVKDTIYNVAGQTMRAVQRGINIIRHSDGTTSKEIRK